jgi:hypothetical protein
MPDYIPSGDADLNSWMNTFMSALDSRRAALGVTEAEFNRLATAHDAWIAAFNQHKQAQAAASSASQAKDLARENVVREVRATARRLQSHPSMQDPDRAALGLTVPAGTRTPPPTPTTRPVARLDTTLRLRHTISFADEATPNSRAKPEGVRGCEIWVKVGDPPPTDPSQLSFLALDTASPYVAEYRGEDAGKIAYYMLRWVNTREEKGPWSMTFSAAIQA